MDDKTKALLDRAGNLTAHLRWEAAECDRTNFGCQFRKDLEDTAALIEAYAAENAQLREQLAAVTAEREKVCYCRECKKSEQRGDIYICEEYGGRWTKDGYCSNGVPREWRGQQGAGEAAHD